MVVPVLFGGLDILVIMCVARFVVCLSDVRDEEKEENEEKLADLTNAKLVIYNIAIHVIAPQTRGYLMGVEWTPRVRGTRLARDPRL